MVMATSNISDELLEKSNEEEAKVRRLEKQFEEISMGEKESRDSYFDRVNEIVEQLRSLKIEISDFDFMKKLLVSSPGKNDGVLTLLKELNEKHNMNFASLEGFLISIGYGNKPITEEVLRLVKKIASDHEELWMVSGADTIHMTGYEKFFTALDRTHKAKVEAEDGTYLMVEGKGDVKIMMKGGKKKTISNVLFVPKIDKNVLSVSQLKSRGYSFIEGERGAYFIRDRTGADLGDNVWVGEDLAMRLRVIEGDLTS